MASDVFSKANEEFVSENYQRAVELYTEAIKAEDNRDDFYSNRAQAYIKLDKFEEAREDCTKALAINSKNTKAYLRKGVASFHLKDYQCALDAFREGETISDDNSSFKTWIKQCETQLASLTTDSDVNKQPSSETPPSCVPPAADPVPMPKGPKTRYDWYQTQTQVIVTVLLKNIKKEDLTTNIQETSLGVTVKMPNGADYSLELDLANAVVPEQSQTKVMSTKVEIKLKKAEGIQWTKLENDGQINPAKPSMMAAPTNELQQYPSSSQHPRNWDKLAQEVTEEEKNEKPEGDAALNSLFQQIYKDGSDEVKRAMIKSFYESGGTVLSTNWTEVGSQKVDVKPPDGMEYKKWDS